MLTSVRRWTYALDWFLKSRRLYPDLPTGVNIVRRAEAEGAAFLATTETITALPARPFNHLSVLAYLAISIVVLACSIVTGYLVYSCYRFATRRRSGDSLGAIDVIDEETGMENEYRKVWDAKRGLERVELKPLEREFEPSFSTDAKTFFGNKADSSFDKDGFRYYSDISDVSLCPPSPSSPTPAPKECVRRPEQQKLQSYCPISLYGHPREVPKKITKADNKPRIQLFDSNNIRYIPPLDSCVSDATAKLFHEPKLSPVLGTVIPARPSFSPGSTAASGDPGTPMHGSKRYVGSQCPQKVVTPIVKAEQSSLSSSATVSSRSHKRVRVISGETSPVLLHPIPGTNPIRSHSAGRHNFVPGYF